MDGNGRWAKRRGLPRIEGHRKGADSVREVTRAARELGIQALTLYAFSSQNWDRPIEEVRMLMALLRDYLVDERAEILDNGIRLTHHRQHRRACPTSCASRCSRCRTSRPRTRGMTLCLALSYGGREAIVDAARQAGRARARRRDSPAGRQRAQLRRGAVARTSCRRSTSSIRTSGEQRLSNFLLWEVAYAELYFTDTLWPDFKRAELYRGASPPIRAASAASG